MTYPNATTYPTESAWLESRRESVGASEAPAILGTNPYASALSVYTAKVEGRAEPETSRMRAGKVLERGILELWAAEHDAKLEPLAPFTRWALPEDYLSCTPDALATRNGELVLVQAKNVGRNSRAWDVEPPFYNVMQTSIELAILRERGVPLARAYLVPFFGGDDVREHEVEYDAEAFLLVRMRVKRFWLEHVEAKLPPPPDKYACADDMRKAWRKSLEGKRVEIPADLAVRLRDVREQAKVIEMAKDQAEAEIMGALGDAEIGTVNGIDVVSWKAGVQQRKAQEARTIDVRPLRLLKAAEGIAL